MRKTANKKPSVKKTTAKKAIKKPTKKKPYTPYYVSYEVTSKLGKAKGRREFETFQKAQNFAVRVWDQKSARLISWGTKKTGR